VRAVDTMGRPLESAAPSGELPSVRVQAFVQLANDRMRNNQLVGKDGALGYVLSAKGIDAADAGVAAASAQLAGLFDANAQKAIRDNRLDDANRWLQNTIELDADRAMIANLRADIDAARIGNQRADRARLLVLANQRIAQGKLLEPKGDSAQHYLDLLAAADPNFDGLADTQALLASRAMAESNAALAANNLDRADALARAAADAGAPAADVSDLDAKITTARVVRPAATPEPVVLPENKLKRTFFMAPTYPARARERSLEGWVDLEFTVTKDGTTRDAVVRAAEPANTFDRAALDAVKRWRYEPRVVHGAVVEQRVETRLRFLLSQ
jgi:TonB family protein